MVIQRRCFLKYTAIVALLVFITIRLFPVIYDSLRIAEIVALFIFLAAAFAYGFHHTAIRVLLGASLLIALYFAFFPARPYSEEKLRKGYVSALESYLNTPYVWGGERFTGMDCSGLIRVGLAKAALYEGLQTLNPGLVRNAVQLWMEDTTAKGIRDHYRSHKTIEITAAENLKTLDYQGIELGDMAINETGSHILAYVGNGEWIQADPIQGEVWKGTTETYNRWFTIPVTIVRWEMLAKQPPL